MRHTIYKLIPRKPNTVQGIRGMSAAEQLSLSAKIS